LVSLAKLNLHFNYKTKIFEMGSNFLIAEFDLIATHRTVGGRVLISHYSRD